MGMIEDERRLFVRFMSTLIASEKYVPYITLVETSCNASMEGKGDIIVAFAIDATNANKNTF